MRTLVLLVVVAACDRTQPSSFVVDTGGDVQRGHELAVIHGCHACHDIPDIREPGGHVGPPLAGFATRTFIAGQLPNTPANLVQWIRDPHGLSPTSGMPTLGLSEREARDVAAFVYMQ